MTIRRITISVPDSVARRIRKAAADRSVSAFITDVLEEHLGEAELERIWDDFYRRVRPRPADARRAAALLKKLTAPAPKHAVRARRPRPERAA